MRESEREMCIRVCDFSQTVHSYLSFIVIVITAWYQVTVPPTWIFMLSRG